MSSDNKFFKMLNISPDQYIPRSRHETALRTLRQFSETIEAQKEYIKQLERQLQIAINERKTRGS